MKHEKCDCCGKQEDTMFVHSKCCGGHWELLCSKEKGYQLVCESCGMPASPRQVIAFPDKDEEEMDEAVYSEIDSKGNTIKEIKISKARKK